MTQVNKEINEKSKTFESLSHEFKSQSWQKLPFGEVFQRTCHVHTSIVKITNKKNPVIYYLYR